MSLYSIGGKCRIVLRNDWLAVLGVSLLATLGFGVLRRHDLLDDAYITARYAQNIAAGYGWVWNPRTVPTDGTTAPLWTLLLVIVSYCHFPFVTATLILNALCFGSLGVVGCLLAQRLA
jgi:peptidoglycan/LPS O-acetylase OafA/YrhL